MKKVILLFTGVILTSFLLSVRVNAQSCGDPTGIVVSTVSTAVAGLQWPAVAGATSYDIQYKNTTSTSWITISNYTPSDPSYCYKTIPGLLCGGSYQFKVQSKCAGGYLSNYSTPVTFILGIPSDLNASNITSSSATVSWTSVAGASSYTVRYKKVGAPSWTTPNSVSTNSLVLSPLTASTNYEFQVKNNCTSANNYSASQTFTTLSQNVTPCGIPAGLSVSGVSTNSATLTWDAVPGAIGYELEIPGYASIYPTVNNYWINTLTPLNNYSFRVKSKCSSASLSNFSQSFSFVT